MICLGHDSLDTTLIYAQTDRDTAAFEVQKETHQPITHIDRYKTKKALRRFFSAMMEVISIDIVITIGWLILLCLILGSAGVYGWEEVK